MSTFPQRVFSGVQYTGNHHLGNYLGAIVKFVQGTRYLRVYRSLACQGAAGNPFVFTDLRDDTAGGDTNGDGGASSPAAGNWGKIEFKAGSVASLDYAQIRYGGNGTTGELNRNSRFGSLSDLAALGS